MSVKAYIHSTESFGSVDGPGIRFLVFMQGCTMRCKYCHNPDSWKFSKEQPIEIEALLDKAERFRSYWGEEGGITVSGGEALCQIDALTELFKQAHKRGINTCLDTSAQPFTRREPLFSKFNELMKYTDLILLDIKHIDDNVHRELTGHTNENILDCARYLSEIEKPVWIRHVLVPGITDDDNALKQLRAFIDTLSNIKRVDILPYHSLAIFKWEKLGLDYSLKSVEAPTKDRIENARMILGAK